MEFLESLPTESKLGLNSAVMFHVAAVSYG